MKYTYSVRCEHHGDQSGIFESDTLYDDRKSNKIDMLCEHCNDEMYVGEIISVNRCPMRDDEKCELFADKDGHYVLCGNKICECYAEDFPYEPEES